VTAEDVLGEGDLRLHVSLDNMTLALKPTTTLAEDRCRRCGGHHPWQEQSIKRAAKQEEETFSTICRNIVITVSVFLWFIMLTFASRMCHII